jgi:hypothetical protein
LNWALANAESLKTHLNQLEDPQTHDNWTTHVVSLLWQYGVLDRWMDHNASVYSHSEEERLQKRIEEIDRSIRCMHTHDQHHIQAADQIGLFSLCP